MSTLSQSYLYANRKEIDITLLIKEGVLPEDLYGVVYLTSMCGSLNSGGLPIPEKHPGEKKLNPEFGTPIMAGDGMIFKIDFNTIGEVHLKTAITKPPCYYADLATSRATDTIEDKFKNFGFKTAGLARASIPLGFRNELNTAILPFRFSKDNYSRLLITYDTGRPWEFNPETLELITPIGANREWINGTPPALKFPFPPVQTSAHPSFDPVTQELYTVNYTQAKPFTYAIAFLLLLIEHRDEVKQHFEEFGNFIHRFEKLLDKEKIKGGILKVLKLFFNKLHRHEHFKPKINALLAKHKIAPDSLESGSSGFSSEDKVYLLKWKGEQGPLQRWKVVDENGNDLKIEECMHQTALTEDYILLADSSFKFAPDLLFTNPFPEVPVIDRMLRRLLNERSPLDMALYIIKKSDLKEEVDFVKAKRVSLPADCIHFTADYKNPDGMITLYTLNNNSVCVAEWIRPYDVLQTGKPVYPELIGLPTIAAMDLNSISRYKINSGSEIVEQLHCMETGGPSPGKITKGHTWEIALMTHRDMTSSDTAVPHIKNLYVFSAGLSTQRLTDFMYDLYKDIPERNISLEEVMQHTQAGVPACLFRMDTVDMTIKDSYVPEFNTEIRSIQFIPAKQEKTTIDYSMNGYLFCSMMVGENKNPNAAVTMKYSRELWLFDATNLSQGPICKLTHPELSYSFTLHAAWIPEAVEQESDYYINVLEDFEKAESFLPGVQKNLKEFFAKYIYHHFEKTGNRKQEQAI
jgi:carotenoid cleavage dioxygenase-like enzyme